MDQSDDSSQLKPLGLSVADAMVIGKKLSEAREQRRITVSDLARKVKIREHFASAIERGDWASLPPGLNGRGLVRIYARELGVGVPELEPSVHLSAVNAKFERAEQQNTEEVLRAQTIRSYRVDEVQPRSAPPKPASRGVETRPSAGSSNLPRPVKAPVAGHKSPSFAPNGPSIPKFEPPHSRFEANDEESPLDVLTPDIAAVLGLNLDGSGSRAEASAEASAEARPSDEEFAREENTIPTVCVDDILGTEIGRTESEEAQGRSPLTPVFKVPSPPLYSETKDSPSPVVSVFPSIGAFDERVTLPEPSLLPTTVPIPQSPYREQPNSAVASYVDQIARTHPESIVRGESLVEDGAASSVIQTDSDSASLTRQRRAMGLRLAVVGAVVVVAAGIGIGFYLIPTGPHEPDLHIKEIATDPAPAPEKAAPESQAVPGSGAHDQGVKGLASVASAPAEVVTKAGAANGSVAAGTEPKSLTHETEPSSALLSQKGPETAAAVVHGTGSGESAEARPEAQKSDAPAAASSPVSPVADPNQRSFGAGNAMAKLVITEPVDIQVRIDDAVVLDGRQEPGSIQVLFAKKTEIVVQDGSKVELTYGDWVHGPLGQKGRKRRIILNAARFHSEASPQTSP